MTEVVILFDVVIELVLVILEAIQRGQQEAATQMVGVDHQASEPCDSLHHVPAARGCALEPSPACVSFRGSDYCKLSHACTEPKRRIKIGV